MECNKNHTIIKQCKVVKNTIFFLSFFFKLRVTIKLLLLYGF